MNNTEKTITNGYYQLPNGQWLHFSMNCWFNLQKNTGKDIQGWNTEYAKAVKEEDMLSQYNLLSELAFAAARAHDQEEDVEIKYNFFKVRSWMDQLDHEHSVEFFKAFTWNASIPDNEKKKMETEMSPKKNKAIV